MGSYLVLPATQLEASVSVHSTSLFYILVQAPLFEERYALHFTLMWTCACVLVCVMQILVLVFVEDFLNFYSGSYHLG